MPDQQPIQAKVRILGCFYKGEGNPLVFSVEYEDHRIGYAEIPSKDTEFRQLAKDTNKPLEQWVGEWNDLQIEIEQKRFEALKAAGLAMSGTLSGEGVKALWEMLRGDKDV